MCCLFRSKRKQLSPHLLSTSHNSKNQFAQIHASCVKVKKEKAKERVCVLGLKLCREENTMIFTILPIRTNLTSVFMAQD